MSRIPTFSNLFIQVFSISPKILHNQQSSLVNEARKKLCKKLTGFQFNSASDYRWGVSAVTTRINHLPNENGEPILSLIPLWDLCNHEDSEHLCTDYNEEEQTLICYAGHDYEQGSEFTIFYGRRSSVDFLVHNGFVPLNYRHDYYNLELGIGANDSSIDKKKAILGKLGLQCHSSFPIKPDTLFNCKKLFAFIRVFQAEKGMQQHDMISSFVLNI